MKFYVTYSTAKYEGPTDAVFETEEEVVAFLNQHAPNPDFNFTVIRGELINFVPAETVKSYRRDK